MRKLMNTTFIVIVILTISCKKETQSNADIIYTNINKTIIRSTTNIDYNLDIDKDGLDDMKFRLDLVNAASINSTYYYSLIEVKNDSLSFHCSKIDLDWKGNVIRNSYPAIILAGFACLYLKMVNQQLFMMQQSANFLIRVLKQVKINL